MTAVPAAAAVAAAWRGLTGRPLQATVIGLVALASTAASALALGMAVEANAPFDHAFAKDRGAQVVVTVDTARTTPAQLAATAGARGVTAAAGPFPVTEVSARISLSGATGALDQQVVLTGRASPGGPVDDLALDAGRWAGKTGEVVWARSRNSLPITLGQKIVVTDVPGSPRLTVVGLATSVTNTAQAWVVPAEITALPGPGVAQMLYRFANAGTSAAVSADIAAVRAALPPQALLGAPQSYLTVRQQAAAQIAPFVPFIVAFGVIALVMSVLMLAMVVCSVGGIGIAAGLIVIPAGVALHRYIVPVMGHAGQTDVPRALLSVYSPWELVLLALAGLAIAVGGALGPAAWVARTRTATALRAE